jgi:hypothetical protein
MKEKKGFDLILILIFQNLGTSVTKIEIAFSATEEGGTRSSGTSASVTVNTERHRVFVQLMAVRTILFIHMIFYFILKFTSNKKSDGDVVNNQIIQI